MIHERLGFEASNSSRLARLEAQIGSAADKLIEFARRSFFCLVAWHKIVEEY